MTKPIAAYFDEEAAQHDVQFVHDLGLSPFYDAVEQTLNSCKKQSVVLVLGCGSGLEIERIRFACEVIGIDLSEEMLNVLKRKQLSEGVKLTTVCASFLEWDLGMERYDIVLSCYALHHFMRVLQMAVCLSTEICLPQIPTRNRRPCSRRLKFMPISSFLLQASTWMCPSAGNMKTPYWSKLDFRISGC